jgi:hypothetical protein
MRFLTVLLAVPCMSFAQSPQLRSNDGSNTFLGNLNANRLNPNSVSNPIGPYGSVVGPNSVNNPVGIYGSPVSPYSVNNPFATQAPKIITPNGNYLGTFGANPFAPDSVSNPFGVYGSPLSPTSINNPIGIYGSPISPQGVRNRFATGVDVPNLPVLPSLGVLPNSLPLPTVVMPSLTSSADYIPAPSATPFLTIPPPPSAPVQRYQTSRGTEMRPTYLPGPDRPSSATTNPLTGARQVYRTPRN